MVAGVRRPASLGWRLIRIRIRSIKTARAEPFDRIRTGLSQPRAGRGQAQRERIYIFECEPVLGKPALAVAWRAALHNSGRDCHRA